MEIVASIKDKEQKSTLYYKSFIEKINDFFEKNPNCFDEESKK